MVQPMTVKLCLILLLSNYCNYQLVRSWIAATSIIRPWVTEFDSEKLKSLVEKYSTQSNDIAKVKEYEESIKNIKLSKIYILVDPRIKDAGLPNDASVTYDYGARSFITDAYDNFTWRNGTWFKITNELKFKSDISDSFTKKDVQGHKIYRTLINDSYNSIIVNNNRYFIKSRNIICKNGKYEFCSYQEPNKAVVICPRTKEELYYRKIYNGFYNNDEWISKYWMPKWSEETIDPSARTLNIYNNLGK